MDEIKLTVRKYNGDDAYSWAIFREGREEPLIGGLCKREIPGYKAMIIADIKKETGHAAD